jgi:DNA modification methylase
MKQYTIKQGNNIDTLKQYPDNHFDSIVTDPPYGIEFLGKDWDSNTGAVETWEQCFRVLKPGGYILAFSAARTYHNLATNIEGVGFEIRDQIMWLYSSGFPKAQDIGKAIQKRHGIEKTKPAKPGINAYANDKPLMERMSFANLKAEDYPPKNAETICTSPEAQQWAGWKTALKPAHEPIVMARKPFKGSAIDNVLNHGVGALNIDATRIPTDDKIQSHYNHNNGSPTFQDKPAHEPIVMARKPFKGSAIDNVLTHGVGALNIEDSRVPYLDEADMKEAHVFTGTTTTGMDKYCEPDGKLDATKETIIKGNTQGRYPSNVIGEVEDYQKFFYCPKVNRAERHIGFEDSKDLFDIAREHGYDVKYDKEKQSSFIYTTEGKKVPDSTLIGLVEKHGNGNNHPTVKPVELMKYLVKLVTPEGGKVLDPFCGSGSTGMAAVELGYDFTGCELDPDYVNIATKRITAWQEHTKPTTNIDDLIEK